MSDIIKEIKNFESKNIYLLSRITEEKISQALSYLLDKSSSIENKIIIIKYFKKLFNEISFNAQIFLNIFSNDENKINLYQIIIYHFILFNSKDENSKKPEEPYIKEIKELLIFLLSYISHNKSIYQFIFTFVASFLNKKNNLPCVKKIYDFDFDSNHLYNVLEIINIFFNNTLSKKEPENYFFFDSGIGNKNEGEVTNIEIQNKNFKSINKKILNLDDGLCVLMFIELPKMVNLKAINRSNPMSLISIKLNDDLFVKVEIALSEDIKEDKIYHRNNIISIPFKKFKEGKINSLLVKFNTDLNINLFINNISQSLITKEKNTGGGKKIEIQSMTLLSDFIGICTNILIFRDKKLEGLPKFLVNKTNNTYANGIYKEEHFISFIKAILNNLIDEKNIMDKTITGKLSLNIHEIKSFLDSNLLAIYLPTRAEFSNNNKITQLLLKDSMNNLDAIFTISKKDLKLIGVHTLNNTFKDFACLGGINHILPIIESMAIYPNILTKENLQNFMDLLIYLLNSYDKFFTKENKSDFFIHLSYFLEKISPENFIDLSPNFKAISNAFLNLKSNKNFLNHSKNFHNKILLNEKILFKFSIEEQNNIIKQVLEVIEMPKQDKKIEIIDINIVKIINILLNIDKNRYTKFCCSKHASFFKPKENKENNIAEPELIKRIEPIMKIINELFKLFSSEMNSYTQNNNNNNNNICVSGEKLIQLFEFLTFDISPCLQKEIIKVFQEFFQKNDFDKFNYLNRNNQILFVILFLSKTSIFDVKLDIFNFIMLIFNNLNTAYKSQTNITINNINTIHLKSFIENYILPYYFLCDEENDQNNINAVGNISTNNSKPILHELKECVFVNNIKYKYLTLNSSAQRKLYLDYNKDKLYELIEELTDKSYYYFNKGICVDMSLNVLIKVLSRGNIFLIIKYVEKLKEEIGFTFKQSMDKSIEIYSNPKLLHWLLETCFQTYMNKEMFKIQNTKDRWFKTKINFTDKLSDKEKEEKNEKLLGLTTEMLVYIFSKKPCKLDYLLTWSKYYYDLRNDQKNFEIVRGFIFKVFLERTINSLNSITQSNIKNHKSLKNTFYFFSLLFEYFTFYKIDGTQLGKITDEWLKYQELSIPFINHVLVDTGIDITKDNIFLLKEKLGSYSYLQVFFTFFCPLWKDERKKYKDDRNFYSSYIHKQQNKYTMELEYLLYSYDDILDLKNDTKNNIYVNRGIPVINMLYHYFTILLSISKNKDEFKQILNDFREFILIIILGSTTLCIYNKKHSAANINIESTGNNNFDMEWPNEDQYKNAQEKIKIFTFNCIYFFYNKIEELNEKIKKNDKKEQKLIDNLICIKKYLIDSICYFLRLLNTIYTELKKKQEKKNKHNIKKVFNALKTMIKTDKEGLHLSGPYLFISELYDECFNASIENNYTKVSSILDKIPLININDINSEPNNYQKNLSELEKITDNLLNDSKIKYYFNKFNEKYIKNLFPFINYIIKRKDLVNRIIPVYDNRSNISKIDENVCLVPNYFPEYPFEQELMHNNHKINEELRDDIGTYEIINNFDNYKFFNRYINIKKKLFKYKGVWSTQDFFYDKKKYRLKYKVLNHMTEDYTKIFLTPITDVDYYFPQFTQFKSCEMFRNSNDKIPINIITNISYEVKKNLLLENKNEKDDKDKDKDKDKNKNEQTQEQRQEQDNIKKEIVTTGVEKKDNENSNEEKNELKKDNQNNINKKEIIVVSNEIEKNNEDNKEKEKENIQQEEIKTETETEKDKDKEIENNEGNEILETLEKSLDEEKSFSVPDDAHENDIDEEDITDLDLYKYNDLYLLRKINYKFVRDLNKPLEKTEKYLKLFIDFIEKKNSIDNSEHNCREKSCYVKQSFHIKGIFYNNEKEIGFYNFEKNSNSLDFDQERKACFGSVFRSQKHKYNYYHIKIPYNKIVMVLKRRYFFNNVAIEIFTADKKNYLFKFNKKTFEQIYKNIRYYLKQSAEDIFIDYSKTDYKVGYLNTKNIYCNSNPSMYLTNAMNLKDLYEKWSKWRMSTLKLLMLINIYANRSYNDMNQYPVFPWIITDYNSEIFPSLNTNNLIRPFGTPMGMLEFNQESKDRKELFIDQWQAMSEEEEKDEDYDRYRSHYSTSTYVSYYLIRIFPFSSIRIELQGRNFDDPNRLFITLYDSFKNATSQKADIRELIPEFFCLPEMFYNINDLNLGAVSANNEDIKNEANNKNIFKSIDGMKKLIQGVELPKYSENDGYNFIYKHRELLESPEINEKINEWFNIIFGSKQKGSAAKKINNLFINQTYDDFDETFNEKPLEDKIYHLRMVEFGVTPNQIFKFDTSKRKKYFEQKVKHQLLFKINEELKQKEQNIGDGTEMTNSLLIEDINFTINDYNSFQIFYFNKKKSNSRKNIFILSDDKISVYRRIIEELDNDNKFIIDDEFQGKGKEEELNNDNDEESAPSIVITRKRDSFRMNINLKKEIKIYNIKYRNNNDDSPNILYNYGTLLASGGYWNGNIIIRNVDPEAKNLEWASTTYIYPTNELSPITNIVMDKFESFVLCGNTLGETYVFTIDQNKKYEWKLYKTLDDHDNEIVSMSLSENLNIFITCDRDGYCMLYTLPPCKLYNSFKLEKQSENETEKQNDSNSNSDISIFPDIVMTFDSPLPCFVFYIRSLNALYIYSINGTYLKKHLLNYEINKKGIKPYVDFQCKSYLFIYNSKTNTIDVHDMFDFKLITRSPVINYTFVDFVLSKDIEHGLILVKSKNKEEDSKKNEKGNIYKVLILKDSSSDINWS